MSEPFGWTDGGEAIERVAIAGGGLRASVITWGAVLQDLRLHGHGPPLVLGFEGLGDYAAHSPYFGANAGRVANRIGNARFELDGRSYELDANFLGKHQLHGGSAGFSARRWQLADAGAAHVTLELVSPAGEMGYPGTLTLHCTYRLLDPGIVRIELAAVTDAATLCNVAHHSYFNLDGAGDVLDHTLRIDADRITPVDDELVPTGEVVPVEGTPFDFRVERALRHVVDGEPFHYDVNYCVGDAPEALRPVAIARGARSGIAMEVRTTEPGLQLYDGAAAGVAATGLDGIRYGPHSGFCLEAQRWPDAPNHPGFPSAVLRPGERYEQVTEYRFSRGP